jgi:hypothetical protein
MKEKILIILNTDYHSEVALSLYGSLELLNFDPYIYPIYSEKDYGLIDLCIKYKINYIKEYNSNIKNDFKKAFLITPIIGALDQYFQSDATEPQNYNHPVVQDFKSRMILLIHRPSKNIKFMKYASNILFENPKFIGLSPFSQQINLNYILLSENPVANYLPVKNKLNDKNKIKFLVIGRFQYNNRETGLLESLIKNKLLINRDYDITLLGQDSNVLAINDEKIIFKSNLSEIDFYDELYNCDFIINSLIKSNLRGYFSDCTSSNYNHIFSFRKPTINCKYSNLVYPFPSLTYFSEGEFSTIIRRAINIKEEEYNDMVNNFETTIKNIRLHNKNAIEDLIYK